MGTLFNQSLLRKIRDLGESSISELKKAYLPPEQPGIVQGISAMFDSDMKTLECMGCISIENDTVTFISWP